VSILPKTEAEALGLIEKADEAHADLIEVRLDNLQDPKGLADLAAHGETPKIATSKPPVQGGEFLGTENERKQILLTAAKSGFEYVDVELSNPMLNDIIQELKSAGVKPIVSFHDRARSPSISELTSILEKENASGAEVCKIVTTANRIEDSLALLNFTHTASAKAKIVCFGMGDLGKVSRLLSPVFGGYFTFASLERGRQTASGQMTIQEMQTAYRLLGLL
jgi:3-dehydroquinate dehydratase type I